MNKKLLDRIKRHEGNVTVGYRHMPYRDSLGVLTVGYGRNIQERGLSEKEAMFLLENDVLDSAQELCDRLHFMLDIDCVRFDVFTEMVFNLGINRFLGFKKAIAAAENGDWSECARQMLDSKWARQVGNRAVTLAEIIESGKDE